MQACLRGAVFKTCQVSSQLHWLSGLQDSSQIYYETSFWIARYSEVEV